MYMFSVCVFFLADQKAVAKATVVWKNTVTLGTEDAPSMTAALYAPDAVFWGTASEEVRETPEEIYDYFVSCISAIAFYQVSGAVSTVSSVAYAFALALFAARRLMLKKWCFCFVCAKRSAFSVGNNAVLLLPFLTECGVVMLLHRDVHHPSLVG